MLKLYYTRACRDIVIGLKRIRSRIDLISYPLLYWFCFLDLLAERFQFMIL